MRIAAIYSGETRTFEQCADNHFNDFFDGCEVDTYHSDWFHNSDRKHHSVSCAPNVKNVRFAIYDIRNQYDLKQHEDWLLRMKRNHPIFMLGRIQRMTSKAFEPILEFDRLNNYDLVVRMRYDFKFSGRLLDHIPPPDSRGQLNGRIFCTRKAGGKSSAYNIWDGFAFGSPYIMQSYFNFHNWIPFSLYFDSIKQWKFQPEYVLGVYLRFLGLDVIDTQIVPTRVLPEGVTEEDMRIERTVQYYADLLDFHPGFYGSIENDCPTTTDEILVAKLREKGYDV